MSRKSKQTKLVKIRGDSLARGVTLKISTRGEYGIRIMLDLAIHQDEGPVVLKSIAERQALSESYLEQLISSLRKSGLVIGHRGAQGGYQLAKDPAEIKIGDILRVLEGPIAPVKCVSEEISDNFCSNSEKCATKLFWERLRDSIVSVIDSTSLAELAANSKKLNQTDPMYYI